MIRFGYIWKLLIICHIFVSWYKHATVIYMKNRVVILGGVDIGHLIYEDGRLWNCRLGRFVSPQVNIAGYLWYPLIRFTGKWWFAHTLVALHFIGDSPGDGYEVFHKDFDKCNNHWWNLEWLTHSEIVLRSRGVNTWESKRQGFRHSPEALVKMRVSRERKVRAIRGDEEVIYDSVGVFCESFGTYRRHFNRKVNSIHKIHGWSIRYA